MQWNIYIYIYRFCAFRTIGYLHLHHIFEILLSLYVLICWCTSTVWKTARLCDQLAITSEKFPSSIRSAAKCPLACTALSASLLPTTPYSIHPIIYIPLYSPRRIMRVANAYGLICDSMRAKLVTSSIVRTVIAFVISILGAYHADIDGAWNGG